MKKMKIALIIKDLRHCGAQRVISRLSFILNDAGHEVYVVLFSGQEIDYPYAGQLIVVDSAIRKSIIGKIITTIQRTLELQKVKRRYGVDIAISFLDTPNISNLLTKGKEKVYVSVRNYKSMEDTGLFNFLNKTMIRMLYPKADGIIAVSEAILLDMVINYKLPANKLRVIYNPFDTDQISGRGEEELPKEYREFYKDHRIIISVGRLFYQKGYWNLIKAFAHLKTKYPDTRMVIVGDGDQGKELLELAAAFGVGSDILFVGYQKNPFTFVKKADVYAVTSLFEGFPNALVEAMACGVPVVCADCKSGPREIMYKSADLDSVADRMELADYGVICPAFIEADDWSTETISYNQRVFANALELLLTDERLHSYYSMRALERAKEFSLEECKKKYLELITG